ncbi:MAG: transcriptional regulator [Betaproteobacteria bacterium RIFCSPLOWO2_12_FULL_63_13]|nr:MAG: transcriptional regulator [Betaproteobacteria bacterium RIFCSPLOWO2_02_FULL_63_19]OGA46950.1 MAG: transcriptional regulator [Betaproteobacteria bacterium RIFCSPLOWO2_12_FULL_63_13]
MAQILVVDDEIGIRELLSEILTDEGHSVRLADSATAARVQRARERPDLVLLDIWMPDADGITLLKEWVSNGHLTMPVIMMSGHATIETAVEATRIGAMDFLEKPISLQKLLATVKRALRRDEPRRAEPLKLSSFGRSSVLRDLKKRLTQVSTLSVPVLLRGESGQMPELFARFLHQPNTPWVTAGQALADTSQDVLKQASGGILFIEELAQLGQNQQKNLAFIVSKSERNKLRLVSFTAEDPRRLIETGGFDPLLLPRLSELTLALPALRQHAEDIPDIANLMLAQLVETQYCPPRQFATAALNLLRNFSWPGNLEDLGSAVRALALTSLEETIGAGDVERVLPQYAPQVVSANLSLEMPLREARDAFERAYFEHHLALEHGSIARVAEKCGLERTHLYRKLRTLGIPTGKREE